MERYLRRNFPAMRAYTDATRAPDSADAVIDNSDPAEPKIVRLRT